MPRKLRSKSIRLGERRKKAPYPNPGESAAAGGTDPELTLIAATGGNRGLEGGSWWLGGSLLALAALVAFWPALHAGFIWDDDAHVTDNPCIVGPLGLWDLWTSRMARICPLVLSTFWLEHKLWGPSPFPFHLVNILVHAGGAVVLWRVLLALGVRGAWLGAALWALHPVQVESVAWITELKNTQSGLFYLLSILFYVRMLRARQGEGGEPLGAPGSGATGRGDYALALVFGALGMASKTSVVVLPVVLGLCGWWVEGKWRWRRLKLLAPLVLMSLAAGALALWTQHVEGANEVAWARSVPERLVAAGCVVWFYLGKLLWPHPLIFIYPRWEIEAGRLLWWLPALGGVLLLGLLWGFRRVGWVRALLFALGYFVVALVPVLGLADHYFLRYSFVGDHFQYLASMGPLALAGAGLTVALGRMSWGPRWLPLAACGALLGGLGIVSWRECRKYQNEDALWLTTLAQNPRCWMAHHRLADLCQQRDQLDEAMAHYREAIAIKPGYANAYYNYGNALRKKGRIDEAVAQYRKALDLDPANAKAWNNLGNISSDQGNVEEAAGHFERAVQINPGFIQARRNLGLALWKLGRLADAIAQYTKALEINPDQIDAQLQLIWILVTTTDTRLRDGARAMELARQTDRLTGGGTPLALAAVAAAKAEVGDFFGAVETAERAIRLADTQASAELAGQLREHLKLYRSGRSLRDGG